MSGSFFSFWMLFAGGALLGHVYVYLRLVRPLAGSRLLRAACGGSFVVFTLLLASRRAIQEALDEPVARALSLASYSWIGVLLFLVLATLVLDLARPWWALAARALPRAARAGGSAAAGLPADPGRREVLARGLAGGAGLALAGYGSWRAFAPPEVTELALKVPRLPRALDGVSIVQLTDLHVGPFIRRRFVDELVDRVNALKPDVVAITGDLVDGDVPTLGHSVAALGRLDARFGRYFVTGNHEYYSGVGEWSAYLERLGITVLRNRRVTLGDAGGSFELVGVDDWSGWRRRGGQGYDLDAALAGRDPERAAVLLAHQPANFETVAARGLDVQLSGHTHGGQLFPATLLVGLRWEFTRGLYRRADSHLYVSRGCGFWGPPMRVDSPPELVKLTLTS